jgi:hypothetical protein
MGWLPQNLLVALKNAVTSSIFVRKEQWTENRQLCLPTLLQLLITRLLIVRTLLIASTLTGMVYYPPM